MESEDPLSVDEADEFSLIQGAALSLFLSSALCLRCLLLPGLILEPLTKRRQAVKATLNLRDLRCCCKGVVVTVESKGSGL